MMQPFSSKSQRRNKYRPIINHNHDPDLKVGITIFYNFILNFSILIILLINLRFYYDLTFIVKRLLNFSKET